ncbi:MAG TPA: hypothetical protein VGE41_13215 [Verrucomicrobiae bacterium]
MKVTIEISEKDLKEIMRHSGEKKKGPAIAKFIAGELMLLRRQQISHKFMTGEWKADLPSIEALRQDRKIWQR